MSEELSAKLDELLSLQRGIDARLAALEAKVHDGFVEASRIDAIRDIAAQTEIDAPDDLKSRHLYSMKYVDAVYQFEIGRNIPAIAHVMRTHDNSFTAGERSGPSDAFCLSNGHFKTMLKRYVFAGKTFCAGKRVLDTCCGRGWGANILANYAGSITAFDIDEKLVNQCRDFWKNDTIDWRLGSALDQSFVEDKSFDVGVSMEAIEHFTKADCDVYLYETQKKLRDKAVFIGTSAFPTTRHQADNHPSVQRPDHHYLWTKKELTDFLGKYFDQVNIIDGWMVVAVRG